MRRPVIAANWKMYKTSGEAARFASELARALRSAEPVEVAIAPSFTNLAAVRGEIGGTAVRLAAQNVHPELEGAFTGEVSAAMLVDAGCSHAIVGHSERRALFGETSAFVSAKVAAAQRAGLVPIVCVGETLVEREAGRTFAVLQEQVEGSLAAAEPRLAADLILAYEPVWAIGTGRTATPEIAQEAHAFLRKCLQTRFGVAAEAIRIQYGGSVKPANIAALMAQPDIDGALVGGASLDLESFLAIIRCGREGAPRESAAWRSS
jgi:triosephosphate isomerase (TIM)